MALMTVLRVAVSLATAVLLASGCSNKSPGANDHGDAVALGNACDDAARCASSYCVDAPEGDVAVCSQCAANEDCGAGERCQWDTDAGYFACRREPLGTACTGPDSCASGHCYAGAGTDADAGRCSECAAREDCGNNQDCRYDEDAGYATCVGTNALGDACSESAECASAICKEGVCSNCQGDDDCSGGGSCTDRTETTGYFVCEGGLAFNCNDSADCNSEFCFAPEDEAVCSECALNGDCDVQQACTYDGEQEYARCVGTGELGNTCEQGRNQCEPGSFCKDGVCSECGGDADCADNGGSCVEDAEASYWVCARGLGDDCTTGDDCNSDTCFEPEGEAVCSSCAQNADCGPQQECDFNDDPGYARCVGTGELGNTCEQGRNQCEPGSFCKDGVCSECAADADCASGGACADATADVGYWVCKEPLGAACAEAADCVSDHCSELGPGDALCSECDVTSDCGVQQDCLHDAEQGYSTCAGTGELGDSCERGDQCVSTYCKAGVCSECAATADCPDGGSCVDDAEQTHWVCTGGLGDNCSGAGECNSGACFEPDGRAVCSECATGSGCGPQQACDYDDTNGYAICVGTGELGAACQVDANQCRPGTFCNGGVCSECGADGDCNEGGQCVEDTASGQFVCRYELGSECEASGDCLSGYCYNAGDGGRCSQCETMVDCADPEATCSYDVDLEYAACLKPNGADCGSGSECASGFCNDEICSACGAGGDGCGDGQTCVLDNTSGYYACFLALGEACDAGAQCASGTCASRPGQGNDRRVCSECRVADTSACADGASCEWNGDYRACAN